MWILSYRPLPSSEPRKHSEIGWPITEPKKTRNYYLVAHLFSNFAWRLDRTENRLVATYRSRLRRLLFFVKVVVSSAVVDARRKMVLGLMFAWVHTLSSVAGAKQFPSRNNDKKAAAPTIRRLCSDIIVAMLVVKLVSGARLVRNVFLHRALRHLFFCFFIWSRSFYRIASTKRAFCNV